MKLPSYAKKIAPKQVKLAQSIEARAKAVAKKLMFNPNDPSTWSDRTKEQWNREVAKRGEYHRPVLSKTNKGIQVQSGSFQDSKIKYEWRNGVLFPKNY